MLMSIIDQPPKGVNWIYEVKYDGFRCGMQWTDNSIKLWSRNGKELTQYFPEIVQWCQTHHELIQNQLPLWLDGELVILRTEFQSVFSLVQQRGRLKTKGKIEQMSKRRPAMLMVFDLLEWQGKSQTKRTFEARRKQLENVSDQLKIHDFNYSNRLNLVKIFNSLAEINAIVNLHQCEGLIAKQKKSKYVLGIRTDQWLKVKNYRSIQAFITNYNTVNQYFGLGVFQNEDIRSMGKVKHGFSDEEKQTITTFVQQHGTKNKPSNWLVPPSVCLEVNCLDAKDAELREPSFRDFRFDLVPDQCTMDEVMAGLAQIPAHIDLSKPDKLLFPHVTKRKYLLYLRTVAPLLLPRLKDKRLTMIRYPDGINGHSFYQKHLPDYAPDFIQSIEGEGTDEDILCQDLNSLLWFGNHASLEFHVPFQTVQSAYPDEIVFDLDPPSLKQFSLAVEAAHLIKEMVEHQGLKPLVKTSGKTGLQIHIPLDTKLMTFGETRLFMEAVAHVLVTKYSDFYTIERLKKNRGDRLYIDYVQHAPGKTIIAPYSPRATKEATVATPLFWDEVNEQLNPKDFAIETVPDRLIERGCPFQV